MDCVCSTFLTVSGLSLDIIGFILISISIVKPKKVSKEDAPILKDVFGEPITKNLVTLDYLKSDFKAKLGFILIITGFLLQLAGALT